MTAAVLNVSAYRFVALDALEARRQRLYDDALAAGLKGTVLLAEEGINLFLAGPEAAVRGWLAGLRRDPPFAGLDAKESWSETTPFQRLKVKIKREIIRMNMPAVQPAAGRAPSVSPSTLARWLDAGHDDEGRPVVMLDTRNGFEVDAGAFDGALDWRLHRFSDFPAALAAHREALAGKTVISYCTGGIRCEKAALVMQAMGVEHGYQLEGGILRYFEQTQGAPHWHGRCFVFDEREELATDLHPNPHHEIAA
ncbi:MAG TPA: sulfurtransferase [Ideonella sp.]|uniref:sulfurtransferase n=1 Tax=Ideonella sp. TaxID=1929293 RepID=UPI002E344C83|nr:sulfurtransferase [Ideonella sp.]HEX5685998.1 sulfurtransferase [Ideonella sp.]